MFKVNDTVVYSTQGLSVVKRIETKTIDDKKRKFYVLNIVDNGMTILCPVKTESLRPITGITEAKKIIEFIKNGIVKIENSTWNRRYREFMEDIKTGNLSKIASVYKSLLKIRDDHDLSFGERKMLNHTKDRIVQELMVALSLSELEIYNLITPGTC